MQSVNVNHNTVVFVRANHYHYLSVVVPYDDEP